MGHLLKDCQQRKSQGGGASVAKVNAVKTNDRTAYDKNQGDMFVSLLQHEVSHI